MITLTLTLHKHPPNTQCQREWYYCELFRRNVKQKAILDTSSSIIQLFLANILLKKRDAINKLSSFCPWDIKQEEKLISTTTATFFRNLVLASELTERRRRRRRTMNMMITTTKQSKNLLKELNRKNRLYVIIFKKVVIC